jgi:hypothetical protein
VLCPKKEIPPNPDASYFDVAPRKGLGRFLLTAHNSVAAMPFTRAQRAREAAQVEAQIQESLLTAVEGLEDVQGIGTQVMEEDTKNEILDNKQVVPNIKLVQPVADGKKNEEADSVTKINKSIDIYIDAQQIDTEKPAESSGDEWVLVDNKAKREASGQNNVDSKDFEHGADGYDDHPLVITHTQKENNGIAKSTRGDESEAAGKKGLSHGHADSETSYSLKEDETPQEDVEGGIAGMTTLPIRSNAKSGKLIFDHCDTVDPLSHIRYAAATKQPFSKESK